GYPLLPAARSFFAAPVSPDTAASPSKLVLLHREQLQGCLSRALHLKWTAGRIREVKSEVDQRPRVLQMWLDELHEVVHGAEYLATRGLAHDPPPPTHPPPPPPPP